MNRTLTQTIVGMMPGHRVATALMVAVPVVLLFLHPATAILLGAAAVLWGFRRHWPALAAPLLLAWAVRSLVLVVHAMGVRLPDDAHDAITFHKLATRWSQGAPVEFQTGSDLYPWLLSWPYRLLGPDPVLGEAINVVLQVTAIGLFAAAANQVWDRRVGKSVAWVGAVFPSLVLYGVVMMREALILVLMATWTYHTVRGQAESSLRRAPIAIAALYGLQILQQGFTYIAPIAAAWTLVGPFIHRLSTKRLVLGVLLVAPIYLALAMVVLQADDSPAAPAGLEEVKEAQEVRLYGRAAYPEWTVLDAETSIVFVAAIRFFLLLFAPLPTWIQGIPDAIAFLDGLAYGALILLGLWSFWRRRPDRTLAAVVLMLVVGLAVYAMGTSNYGTGFRHRAKFSLLLMVVAAPQLHHMASRFKSRFVGASKSRRVRNLVRRPRILYLNNDAAGFERQRAPLVKQASTRFDTRVGLPAGRGDAKGFRMWRKSVSPLREWRSSRSVQRFVARQRPDLIHAFTIKPVLYGTMAARRQRVPIVNTITGRGHVFLARGVRAWVLRQGVKLLYRQVLDGRGVVTVFQNRDDHALFVKLGLVDPAQTRVVPGSGVDLEAYRSSPLPQEPIVVLPARMLKTKGVEDFVKAARILRERGVAAHLILVGDPDPGNPASIPELQLRSWAKEGIITWWGHRSDMASVYQRARVVCLPSHGEGVPMVLLEAAACGRPLVATDVPGCRDVVVPGQTGRMVPVQDPRALADALEVVLRDGPGAARMGAAARRHVEQHFDRRRVHALYLELYDELLSQRA